MVFDMVINNGTLIDGTGNPWIKADIGIIGQRISEIGQIGVEKSSKAIDASGLVVCPGFVDIHSHSDLTLIVNPKAESKIRQGISTEIIGNCGDSAAPLNDFLREEISKTNPFIQRSGNHIDWSSMAEYLECLNKQGVAVNVVPLVGHGNVRGCTLEFDNRSPSNAELDEMKKTLRSAMEEGAFGMSAGLLFPPGSYATTEELIELSKVVAQYDGIYTSHIRGESENLFKSMIEAILIGEKGGLPVEISHHKASGKENWGKTRDTLRMIDEARERGVDVTCDVYPYTAASIQLFALLPPWVREGGTEKMKMRLMDEGNRKRLRKEMVVSTENWSSLLKAANWDATMIAQSGNNPNYEGRTIAEIAQEKKMDPFDFTFDLLIEENGTCVVRSIMCEEDVSTVMQHPTSMIATDSSSVAPYGPLGEGKPHPRSYGAFPKVLGKYVREEGILTLENAIRKMTSMPAQRIGIRDRGLIKKGMCADICIFDSKTIMDNATFENPHQFSTGVKYLLVNGKLVLEGEIQTAVLAGQVLRKRKSFSEKSPDSDYAYHSRLDFCHEKS